MKETGPDTSAFSNDSFGLGMALSAPLQSTNTDTLTVFFQRLGDAWTTNTCTETDTNSLIFRSADQALTLEWSGEPAFDTNLADEAVVLISSTALTVNRHQLETWETDTNSLVFAQPRAPRIW